MKRSVWKWTLGISLTFLVLLVIFTVGIWALGNATAALASAIMSYTDNDVFAYNGITLGAFFSNFIGSPMFYVYLADITVSAVSIAALTVTRKQKIKKASMG